MHLARLLIVPVFSIDQTPFKVSTSVALSGVPFSYVATHEATVTIASNARRSIAPC